MKIQHSIIIIESFIAQLAELIV